jgi:plasmid stabilization system protein ParE
MNRIYYTDFAERDIAAIIRFISRNKPGAARRMKATLRQGPASA